MNRHEMPSGSPTYWNWGDDTNLEEFFQNATPTAMDLAMSLKSTLPESFAPGNAPQSGSSGVRK